MSVSVIKIKNTNRLLKWCRHYKKILVNQNIIAANSYLINYVPEQLHYQVKTTAMRAIERAYSE